MLYCGLRVRVKWSTVGIVVRSIGTGKKLPMSKGNKLLLNPVLSDSTPNATMIAPNMWQKDVYCFGMLAIDINVTQNESIPQKKSQYWSTCGNLVKVQGL